MALWTSDAKKMDFVDHYFGSLNPMAARIIESKKRVIRSFPEGAWTLLSVKEQDDALNTTFISNNVQMRYNSLTSPGMPEFCKSTFPALVIETGKETVKQLENTEEWQDEHSEPFSWETKSQMNLVLPPRQNASSDDQDGLSKLHSVVDPPEENVSPAPLKNACEKVDIMKIPTSLQPSLSKSNGTASVAASRPPLRHIDSPPDEENVIPNKSESDNVMEKPQYGLITGERKKTSIPLKPNLTSRINPRASLTLDDLEEKIQTGQKDEGAIRNLEVALKEEAARKKSIPKQPQKSISESSSSLSSKSEPEHVENAPLLKDTGSILTDTSVRKSGFDFLDNW